MSISYFLLYDKLSQNLVAQDNHLLPVTVSMSQEFRGFFTGQSQPKIPPEGTVGCGLALRNRELEWGWGVHYQDGSLRQP